MKDSFDNEGHVIRYTAEFSADQKTLVFLSDRLPSAPRYRLTYTKAKSDTLIRLARFGRLRDELGDQQRGRSSDIHSDNRLEGDIRP